MTDEDAADIVRRYAGAWVRGDAATVIGMYADDIVLHYFGESPIAGDHRGKAAAVAVLGKLQAAVKRGTPEIHDVVGGREHAVMLATEHWGEGGDALTLNRVLVFHVRDGKLSECWVYDDDQRLVDRVLNEKMG